MISGVKLFVIFLTIVFCLKASKQLPIAIACGTLATILVFRIDVALSVKIIGESVCSKMTVTTLLAFYFITFLQRMLEEKGLLDLAQLSLGGIFNNRRINIALSAMIIGMLPSAGAVTICGSIVDKTAKEYLTPEEKAFVTSFYRHIPEAFIPTFSSIIIGVQLSGVPLSSFLICVFPMILLLIFLGYIFYLRKVPAETGLPPSLDRKKDILNLTKSIWSIILIILLIIILNIDVYIAAVIVILLSIFINKFKLSELSRLTVSAFETKLLITTLFIMIFKDILLTTGALNALPEAFDKLPIPTFLIYFLLFFCGTILAGQQAISAIGLPLAFSTIADAGTPLFVLLMCCGYMAMQISPTHICLAIVTEYFNVSMSALIKKTAIIVISFFIALISYYLLLSIFF